MAIRRLRLGSLAVAVALFLLLLWGNVLTTRGQEKMVEWKRMDVAIRVHQDGTFTVTETMALRFIGGPFHRGTRDLPLKYVVDYRDFRVWDPEAEYRPISPGTPSPPPYTFWVERLEDLYRVRWFYPPVVSAPRTFHLGYRVIGGLRYYPEGDQLWWKVIPPDRTIPVEEGTFTVTVPVSITRYALYYGDTPVHSDVRFLAPNRIVFRTPDPVPPHTAVEVRVQWAHGHIAGGPAPWQEEADKLQAQKEALERWNRTWRPVLNLFFIALGLLILVLGSAGIYLLWYTRGRDAPTTIYASYLPEPPSDVPPGLVGALLDERVDVEDILATILDLARRGVLDIAEVDTGWGKDFLFRLKQSDLSNLRPFERRVVDALFADGTEQRLSALRHRFYAHIPIIQSAMYREMVERGWFAEEPNRVRRLYTFLAYGLFFLAGFFVVVVAPVLSHRADTAICPGLALFLPALLLLVIAHHMPRKTRKGAEEAAKWRAFRQYLKNLDTLSQAERAEELLNRYLPYAVAMGVQQTFLRKFESALQKAGQPPVWPQWYSPSPEWVPGSGSSPSHGGTRPPGHASPSPVSPPFGDLSDLSQSMGGGLSSLSRSLGSMLSSASSTLTSRPSGGGGGGGWSGGGGFSGGGGGGGGGAGFD